MPDDLGYPFYRRAWTDNGNVEALGRMRRGQAPGSES